MRYKRIIIFSGILLAANFSVLRSMNDYLLSGKWVGCLLLLLLALPLTLYSREDLLEADDLRISFIFTCASIIFICTFQLFGLIASPVGEFRCTADYDNPAGVAISLVACLPFALQKHETLSHRVINITLSVISTAIIVAIENRSGLLALTVVFLSLYINTKTIRFSIINRWLVIIFVISVLLVVVLLTLSKTNSTAGRYLILNTSWKLFLDAPLLGHGIGGFQRLYMEWQASNLKILNDSHFNMLADNVTHPLNEYLKFAVDYGIVGLSIILTLFAKFFHDALTVDDGLSRSAISSVIGIGFMALFSYPFRYPIVWLCMTLSMLITYRSKMKRFFHSVTVKVFAVSIYMALFVHTTHYAVKQVQWFRVSHDTTKKVHQSEVLKRYSELEKSIGRDPYFQYNYAFVLHEMGVDSLALNHIERCSLEISGYDIEMLKGNVQEGLGQFNDAILSYEKASGMCPSRFTPPYNLFCLHRFLGNREKTFDVGRKILSMPIKVNSNAVQALRLDVRQYLNENY